MARPTKRPEDTVRGRAAIKKEQKEAEKMRKQQLKEENATLAAQGLRRDADGEIRTFAESGRNHFRNAPAEAKEKMKNDGRRWHTEVATEAQKEKMTNDGRYWHTEVATEAQKDQQKAAGKNWFAGAPFEQQLDVAGAGSGWFDEVASPEEQEQVKLAGRDAWGKLVGEALAAAQDGQERGREVETAHRAAAANLRHNTPGAPFLRIEREVWECEGPPQGPQGCDFSCLDNLSCISFYETADLTILKWVVAHHLMDTKCEREGGDCVGYSDAIALGDRLGLRCNTCHFISKGGLRSFWAKGKMGMAKMMALVWGVVEGFSYQQMSKIRIPCNKNTFTSFVKDIGNVCAEALERNRRDPDAKYLHAQADETAFGVRKYRKGRRVRKGGVQWALTLLAFDPTVQPRKALAVDLQFLPGNKRTIETLTPPIVQRMVPGGSLTTDGWKAYEQAARAAQVTHYVVNHKREFVTVEGDNTNGAEGIHAVVKKDGRAQFGRLPYLTRDGRTYYLDLLIWRANARLSNGGSVNLFKTFCYDLALWTHLPLEDFDHTILPFEEDAEEEDGDDNEDGGDDWFIDADDISEEEEDTNDPDWDQDQ